ncbi:type II toxin-antitoxin system HicB family antitoxin [Jiella sp. MQZ13P-4]|uniref:Type II toxin-antitoxin system HicB family antitoxin n=2 Tax=Jiella sonneratiae TaxID=2816856 RepID=A0ABS3JD16_9HYPH|nr:type II toxin-antitoxin system HicB family antitoxin [Jiella sonneratiae]
MSGSVTYTVQLRPEPEGGYTVLVPALPEVVSYGESREEALENGREAIHAVLEYYDAEGIPRPDDVVPLLELVTVAA